MGHVKDLPGSKLGVDVENNFTPTYIVIPQKKKVLSELKKSAEKAEKVFLAPDPDREGEAIAWHVAEEIRKPKMEIWRATFNEITKKAVLNAINNPMPLDEKKFNAQQARRILDRLVGYKISPLLWRKVKIGLSAGRVQSVALKIVCEREKEIREFKTKEYWTIEVLLEKDGKSFWTKVIKFKGNKLEINTKDDTEKIAKEIKNGKFIVENVQTRERRKNPSAPFITSLLQQDASGRLRFSPKKTMLLAQKLYEGVDIGEEGSVALITYMRTDSYRVSHEAINSVRQYIDKKYGTQYLPQSPNTYKARSSAQEAHEAIRPVSMDYPPEKVKEYLDKDGFALYELIWNRFVASQMQPALYDQTSIDISAGNYLLRATGSVLKFQGFLAVYSELEEKESETKEDEKAVSFPQMKKTDELSFRDIKNEQHFTQPPPRYTEAMLVKELEEKGIGRPSTYAAIVSTIQERKYAEKQNGRLAPTTLGFAVNQLLIENFPDLINVEFTAGMEEGLDNVEDGKIDWLSLLNNFYTPFKTDLENATANMRSLKAEGVPTNIKCEKCGGTMVIRWGKNGEFLACSKFPDCKNTMNFTTDENGNIVPEKDKSTDMKCDKCGKPMVLKSGRFGKFLACSGYPECKNIKSITSGVKCPECGGDLLQRKGKRGMSFYGCSKYPDCKFTIKSMPIPEKCPVCGYPFLIKAGKSQKNICPKKDCTYGKD